MSRKARRQITDLVTPRLDEGEELLGAAAAWAARLGRTPLLLTGRHLHLLALTDRRLIVFERRHRRGREAAPVLDEPIDQLTLARARARLTLYQVLVATATGGSTCWSSGAATTPPAARSHGCCTRLGSREWRSCSRSTRERPACAPSRSTSTAVRARTRTGSSPSTSRDRVGSNTTHARSGARCPTHWREVVTALDGEAVAAIGITNQRETTVVWDRATGAPLHRALVWQDRRTAQRCDALRAAGYEPLVRARTGLVLDPYFSATKLEWLLTEGGVERTADARVRHRRLVDPLEPHRRRGGRRARHRTVERESHAALRHRRAGVVARVARAVRRPGVVPP